MVSNERIIKLWGHIRIVLSVINYHLIAARSRATTRVGIRATATGVARSATGNGGTWLRATRGGSTGGGSTSGGTGSRSAGAITGKNITEG